MVGRLTFPDRLNEDWLTSGSGRAGLLSVPSMELDPWPPVQVMVPPERLPSAEIGTAATAFVFSLVRK